MVKKSACLGYFLNNWMCKIFECGAGRLLN